MNKVIGILCGLIISFAVTAQQKQVVTIPVDKDVQIGQLKNGLKYYIRYNKKPEKRVEMRLIVNAGSILESEEQKGLAHFVEHMCFNGTKNFEKNDLVKYFQSIGMEFGPEVNAYTSFDETVYMLTLPSDSIEFVNNGLQVMEDWAHNVTFDHEEIDKERGVVMEEWRMGRGPWQRMYDKHYPVIFKDSRYAVRLPIGDTGVIKNSDYETIKQFYNDWYRPELMAFIVVGDIDVDEMETKIEKYFSNLQPLKKPQKRESYSIPDNKGTLVSIATDKEAPYTVAAVIYKGEIEEFKTTEDFKRNLIYSLITGMINQRLSELTQQAEPPFIGANVSITDFIVRNKTTYFAGGMVHQNGIKKGLEAILIENNRVKNHGFTEGELERQKKKMLTRYEKAYKERDKTESKNFTEEYLRNFIKGEAIPGIEYEYNFVKQQLPEITLEEVNSKINELIKNNNRIVLISAPEKEEIEIPDKTSLLALLDKTDNEETEPYIDKVSGSDLMAELPENGRILFKKKIHDIDAVELKLANGAKVVLKSTDFKKDEILMKAESPGGQSIYPTTVHYSATNTDNIINESGISDFSKTDLTKILAGKTVNVKPFISNYSEGINGSCSPKDMETMFQLVHLYFTKVRKDSTAYLSYINKMKSIFKNLLADPVQYYYNEYNKIVTQNHPRANVIMDDETIWDQIELSKVMEIYNERFADVSDFTFFFVGAFDIDSIKPLIEKYIASLPSIKREENWKDMGIRPPDGLIDTAIYRGADQKSFVNIYFEQEADWDAKDAHIFSAIGNILNRRYIEKLREEMSGVYGVGASAKINRIPYENAVLRIMFPCSPDNTDSLTMAALDEIRKIQDEGPTDDDIKKAHEIERRKHEENLEKNRYWLNKISNAYKFDTSFDRIVNFDETLEELTKENIQRVAKQYIDLNEYIRVVLYPKE